MAQAEFEEKEYEGTLYNQLRLRNRHVWEPGQVLEGHIGLDMALFCVDNFIWNLHGYRTPLRGVILADHSPEWWWRRHRLHRSLPDFSLNLFLQAKRPTVGKRAPAKLARFGLTGRYWKFSTKPHQQAVLESLASPTRGRALVCYASPAFDRLTELYEHTRRGTVVKTSTFPNIVFLKKHSVWYYNQPGKFGIANPDPERIDEIPLEEKINQLLGRSPKSQEQLNFSESLSILMGNIEEAIKSEEVESTERTAMYFQYRAEINEYLANFGLDNYGESVQNFLRIVTFTWLFQLQWYVLAQAVE